MTKVVLLALSCMVTWLGLVVPVDALSVGEPVVQSRLGAPLLVTIPLGLRSQERQGEVRVTLASRHDYDAEGVPWTPVLAELRARFIPGPPDVVQVVSEAPIQVAVFDLLIAIQAGSVTIIKTAHVELPTALAPAGTRAERPDGRQPARPVASRTTTGPPTAHTTVSTAPMQPQAETGATPSTESPSALYQQALHTYRQHDYDGAMALFQQFLALYPNGDLAGNAQYWTGESLYAQRQWRKAIAAFETVLHTYPTHGKVAAATLKLGYTYATLDDLEHAKQFFEQVQQRYPQSPEARLAETKLQQLQERAKDRRP